MMLLGALTIQSMPLVYGFPAVASSFDLSPRQTIPIPPALSQFPSGPLNEFLRIISTLPESAAALDAVGLVLTPLQQALADATGTDTTENDLEQNTPCADLTVIFARGTTEPGNIGLVTGPPFLKALREQLGSRTHSFQGIEYPATFAGFNANGTNGIPSMYVSDFVN